MYICIHVDCVAWVLYLLPWMFVCMYHTSICITICIHTIHLYTSKCLHTNHTAEQCHKQEFRWIGQKWLWTQCTYAYMLIVLHECCMILLACMSVCSLGPISSLFPDDPTNTSILANSSHAWFRYTKSCKRLAMFACIVSFINILLFVSECLVHVLLFVEWAHVVL